MIVYRKKFLGIVEYWNNEKPDAPAVDLIRCFQQPHPIEGMICREFFTILLDINRDDEEIFGGIKRDTRYEIRRATSKDGLSCDYFDGMDSEAFQRFCDYYDEFANQKAQPKLNRAWLSLLAESGALTLSRVNDASEERETLVWHAYHRSNVRATLLYSASLFREHDDSARRNMIGRANRFLHWQDILRFKAAGVSVYDFGGWYEGTTNRERLSINHFKEEFGGEIVKNYICERAITIKAKLFLRLRRLLLGNAI